MQTDLIIKKHFEKSMKDYEKNAIVQSMMASKMMIELCKISTDFEYVLELGCGTGLLTKKILNDLKFKKYYANDLIEKSKNYVQKIIPNSQFLCGSALKIRPTKKMDLIISNAMFQWFGNLDKAIEILKRSLNKGGILAFSTFGPENFKEINALTGLSLNYKTKDEIVEILQKQGFEVLYAENFYEELTFKTPLELLAHMKNTGVNSLSEKTWTITKVKEFCDKYSKMYPKSKLTYSPIVVITRWAKADKSQLNK